MKERAAMSYASSSYAASDRGANGNGVAQAVNSKRLDFTVLSAPARASGPTSCVAGGGIFGLGKDVSAPSVTCLQSALRPIQTEKQAAVFGRGVHGHTSGSSRAWEPWKRHREGAGSGRDATG